MTRGGGDSTGFWWWCLRERDHLEDLLVDERIILKYTFRKRDGTARTALLWLVTGKRGGRAFVNTVMNLQVP